MNDKATLKNTILSLLPESLGRDVKDSIDAAIQRHFEGMNLVSRQEFDIQRKVLAKTRAKLELLEQDLQVLESK